MKKHSLPTFAQLNQTLDKTALKLHASQVHGLISGLLCGKPTERSQGWEALITGEDDKKTAHEVLQSVYDSTAVSLSDYLFQFQLVLPDDNTTLGERAEALTVWCQGFLTGLKLAEVPLVGREPSELTEAINDLIEIAKMNYDQVIESEEDESAFAELVEYVRMAVVFIYQEHHEAAAPSVAPDNGSYH
jgi:yecA family protein